VQDRQRKQGGANELQGSDLAHHARNVRHSAPEHQSQIRVRKNAYLPCGNGRRKMEVLR
jgi:hypothetical protein